MIHVGTAATMNYSQWTCLLLGTLRWALAGWGRTQQPGEHIQLLGGVSSFQVSLEHLLLQSERGHREFWWDLAQWGSETVSLFSLRAQRGWVPSYCLISCPVHGQYRWLLSTFSS